MKSRKVPETVGLFNYWTENVFTHEDPNGNHFGINGRVQTGFMNRVRGVKIAAGPYQHYEIGVHYKEAKNPKELLEIMKMRALELWRDRDYIQINPETLTAEDREIFQRYLEQTRHNLTQYEERVENQRVQLEYLRLKADRTTKIISRMEEFLSD